MDATRKSETIVNASDSGRRLDSFLAERFNYHSRSQWQKKIKDGQLLLNGRKTDSSSILRDSDRISYRPKEERELAEEAPGFEILHECEEFLVVNKPANLVCHPAGAYFKNTLWFALRERFGEVFIVNRLDRESSGIVLSAKDKSSASKLAELFALENAPIAKIYLTIVHGSFPNRVLARGFLCQDEKSPVRKKRAFIASSNPSPGDGGEIAETEFRLLTHSGAFSAVAAVPFTGRTHQIRATLLSLSYPIVGDKLYGKDETAYLRFIEGKMTEKDRSELVIGRQALHAAVLVFRSPFSGKNLEFFAETPEEFSRVCPMPGEKEIKEIASEYAGKFV